MANTRTRSLRVPDEVWEPARQKAAGLGLTMTDVVCELLQDWTDIPATKPPRAPRKDRRG